MADYESAKNDVCSIHSDHQVYVQFRNRSDRLVDLLWVDYAGKWIRYRTLSPGASYDVRTYVTHPWLFVDRKTGFRLMAVGRGRIFRAEMSDYTEEDHLLIVTISVPMFSLRERCLEILSKLIDDEDSIDQLQIPSHLKIEIQEACELHLYRIHDTYQNGV